MNKEQTAAIGIFLIVVGLAPFLGVSWGVFSKVVSVLVALAGIYMLVKR